jgi:glycosyltransferase involved in cell wall biosynthesis
MTATSVRMPDCAERPVSPPEPCARTAAPLRVCFLIDRLGVGGSEAQLLALIRHLDRCRVEPHLCLLDGSGPVSQALEPADCPTLRLGVRSLHHAKAVVGMWRLARYLRRRRIDILQVYFPDSTYLGVLAGRLAGVPAIVRTRLDLGYWLTRPHRFLGRLYQHLIDASLTNCEAVRDLVQGEQGLAGPPVYVLENGVDLGRFAAIPMGPGPVPSRVGMVANLRSIKDPELFVQAAADVGRWHPAAEFRIAGSGPLQDRLQQLALSEGIRDRFHLEGNVADVLGFLAGLDVAVLCSRSEAMSNALLEYMAAGRPVVATAVGGNVQLVRHEVDGLLVPPGDRAALAASIDRLLRDRPLALRLATAARRRATEAYSLETRARRFEAFYADLLRTPRVSQRVRKWHRTPDAGATPVPNTW